MVQTYQGYFVEDGCFISDGSQVKFPSRRWAIVNILDDEVVDSDRGDIDKVEESTQSKLEIIRRILAEAKAAEDELTDEDWEELENIREKTNAGFSRMLDL